jgi:hypothetical protein
MRFFAAAAAVAAAAAQGSWSVISSQVGQGASGLAFFDANTGIIATSDGFLGYNVYLSSDGGKSWAATPNQAGYFPILSDTAAFGSFGVACGASTQFSWNRGAFFNTSVGGAGGVNARVLAGQAGFALIGQFGSSNGVATSTDGGVTFTAVSAGLTTTAGFGSFPTATTWYVTGGDAPAPSNDQTDQPTTGTTSTGGTTTSPSETAQVFKKRVSSRVTIVAERNGPARHVFSLPSASSFSLRGRALQGNNTGYDAQITKTTDGGQTWTSLFSNTGLYAMNGIDCRDANNCCAVAEASSGTAAGAYIFCATDGATFTTTYNSTNPGDALVDIRAVGTSTYIAVGGNIGASSISASWLVSNDNGQTWAVDTSLPNYFATGIECLAGSSSCWSTVVDNNDNSYVAAN